MCQKCGQPLEPWEAGICEGCLLNFQKSSTTGLVISETETTLVEVDHNTQQTQGTGQ